MNATSSLRNSESAFRHGICSGRAVPVMIVGVALVASTLLFFFSTRNKMQEKKDPSETSAPMAPTVEVPPSPTPASQPEVGSLPNKPALIEPTPSAPSFGFARPLDLGQDLARSLAQSNWERAGRLIGSGVTTPGASAEAEALVKNLVAGLGYLPGSAEEVVVLGQMESLTRIAIPLKDPDGKVFSLEMDLERDEKMGWKIAQLRFPKPLAEKLALVMPDKPTELTSAAPATPPPSEAPLPPSALKNLIAVDSQQDALSFADSFVKQLLSQNFAEARALIDESKVPTERLAGLCIVFEEGEYQLMAAKPLIITATGEDASWVIAQVRSDLLQQQTEFGVELQRGGADEPWKVVGLNLSDLLGSFARSTSRLGIPYTPIIKNPTGGESLALYFEYDDAGLHPRAHKQLQIVAQLLKTNSERRLRIAGHTDALGAEDYNLTLSERRARTVKEQLVALGVDAVQIETTGLGKAQPLSPNQKNDGTDDPEGRSRNRRAEIYLDF